MIVILAIIIVISILLATLLKEQDDKEISFEENTNVNISSDLTNSTSDNEDSSITDDEDRNHVVSLYQTYKQNLLNAPAEIYNRLDPDFKAKRFPTEEKFKEYLTGLADYIDSWEISKFKKELKGDYTQYIILNNEEHYLYINEKSEQEYTYILDNHTIEKQEDIEKYNNATNKEKADINTEKIIDAINSYDYEYIYNKLDNGFKQKNFKTLDSFKNYFAENIFFGQHITVSDSTEEGDMFIREIAIEDYEGMIVKMKLLDNRDFVVVFSIEDYGGTVE